MAVHGKHRRTLERIFDRSVPANIEWQDIESLIRAMGGQVSEGRGSRVRFHLNCRVAVIHRPHPRKEAVRATVKDVRAFLIEARVMP